MTTQSSLVEIDDLAQPVDWHPVSDCPVTPVLVVMRANLSRFEAFVPHLAACLSPAERARADRFVRPFDQARYVVGRGLLRQLLAGFTQQKPATVVFKPDAGKPSLAHAEGPAFNVSHSGDWIVYAFDSQPVGIDVEQVNPSFTHTDIVHSHFTLAEQQVVRENPAHFYTLWTRKEALLKALGRGLDDDLRSVPALAGSHPLSIKPGESGGTWTVRSFVCAPQYPAALAYRKPAESREVTFYELDETVLAWC
ncbi:4'-phosphopantetheinyl transferase family protein [Larkinella sp. VNQ87]|uniref:4'-phosphopantetheinyl transferase family protein n=1 Tax=Larkinella sp. VNQ87 TaxID=3400921 RepID=UPI003C11D3F8